MITSLKKRPRSDSQTNQARTVRKSWDRPVYLCLLFLFFLSLCNYAFGDRVYFKADGLVLREKTVISATSLVRVVDVKVQAGQSVEKGDILFTAKSSEILDRLADYSMRIAELGERSADLRGQVYLAEQLLPLAQERVDRLRLKEADSGNTLAAGLAAKPRRNSLLTASRRQILLDQAYDAEAEHRRLLASEIALQAEIDAVEAARIEAEISVQRLSSYYSDGIFVSPISGIVTGDVPSAGEVYKPGEQMTSVLWGPQYILAYLPRGYLLPLSIGQDVRIRSGNLTGVGVIEKILPVSQSLPDEFQNTFRSRERRQLARIKINGQSGFPNHATVRVSLKYF